MGGKNMENTALFKGFSGTALKRVACVSMLLDHIGASCVAAVYTPELYWFYRCLRWAGRIAFPIYCFLLVEGFAHTRDLKRYAGRLLVFALVSEIPFDWAFFGSPIYWQYQNVYWTLLLGLSAMACLEHFCPEDGSWGLGRLLGIGGALLFAGAAELAQTDYGATGVLLIVGLYLTRRSRPVQCLTGALIVSYELPAPAAFLPIWFYNGQRGNCGRVQRWIYYWFYPVHLTILAAVTNCILLA